MTARPAPTERDIQRYIGEFIHLLRTTDPRWFHETFTNGACFRLFEIVNHLWPESEAWVAKWPVAHSPGGSACHVYTRIGERFCDITGYVARTRIIREVSRKGGRFERMSDAAKAEAKQWVNVRLVEQGRGPS